MCTSNRVVCFRDRRMMWGTRGLWVLGVAVSCAMGGACGASSGTDEPASLQRLRAQLDEDTRDIEGGPGPDGPRDGAGEEAQEEDAAGPGEISRSQLDATLAEGPGRFLQGVVTEPHREEGRFVGFRLMSFFPADPRFEGVDLRRGDVVTRVNGTFIERPEQLIQVWEALASAEALVVHYLRGGEARTLNYSIVD